MNENLAAAWRKQIDYCDAHGSPFTAHVLAAAWADWIQGGALRSLMPDWPGDAWTDVVPLRLAGALHSLALDGSSAALAALYPPQAATFDARRGPSAIAEAMRAHPERISAYLQSPPQTNEIGRSAVLLGGFAAIAQATGLPLALLEMGASAGLNQLWHRYRYELGGLQWGDAASPVLIRSDWHGALPNLPARIDVAASAACDIAPIDLHRPGAGLRLASYVWPDQTERVERLRAAIDLARQLGVAVERADAGAWVSRQLTAARPGRATVLYHSIMWHYMQPPLQTALRATIAAASERATHEAPLAWLSFELPDPNSLPELALTLWPGGERRVLADAHAHGHYATWR